MKIHFFSLVILVAAVSGICSAPADNHADGGESACQDDGSFRFRGKEHVTCDFISKRQKRIHRWCQKESPEGQRVSMSCPVACGACSAGGSGGDANNNDSGCRDDETFRFEGEPRVTCGFVSRNQKRIHRWCPKTTPDGRLVSDSCPETCGMCSAAELSTPVPTAGSSSPKPSACAARVSREGLSPADVERSFVAARLARLVEVLKDNRTLDEESEWDEIFGGPEEPRGDYYESGIDAVYTTRIQDKYCFVVFRGTQRDLEDWMSNGRVDPVVFEPGQDEESFSNSTSQNPSREGSCDVHEGWHESYAGFAHRAEVEAILETCPRDCPGCEVVLAGHSQGGGIAQIAALYYKDTAATTTDNLYVVTLGGPPALGAGCMDFFSEDERCRHFRYIMSTPSSPHGIGRVYDVVPMIAYRLLVDRDNDGIPDGGTSSYARNGGLAFLGHELFLDSGDSSAVAAASFDGHYSVPASSYDVFTLNAAHKIDLYGRILREQHLAGLLGGEDGCECNLPTDGFAVGSLCNPEEADLNCIAGVTECIENPGTFFPPSFGNWTCWARDASVLLDPHRFCRRIPQN